jgi:hypothetical protein
VVEDEVEDQFAFASGVAGVHDAFDVFPVDLLDEVLQQVGGLLVVAAGWCSDFSGTIGRSPKAQRLNFLS